MQEVKTSCFVDINLGEAIAACQPKQMLLHTFLEG